MVDFLVKRPIGSTMIFIALIALGLLLSRQLPVSLMPNVDVPQITIQATYDNYSATQMEQNILQPLRNSLQQTLRLDEITSEARNGQGLIRMRFEYGTDVALAAIEVNEKVDQVTDRLPGDMSRPNVIKASALDIPIFTINVSLRNGSDDPEEFLELSEFVDMVIKRRIVQVNEVAMVDISGLSEPEILIQLDTTKVSQIDVSFDDINRVIQDNNREIGNIILKEGFYQYNVKMGNQLVTEDDLKDLLIRKGNQIYRLEELANVKVVPKALTGLYEANGRRAIAMNIIKQSDAQLAEMSKSVRETLDQLITDYPELDFEITRDQSALLTNTIGSLKGSLIIGSSLAFLVMFFFLRDIRAPFLIGLSIPVSVIIALFGFRLVDLTINIVSLSGLLLGVGMMIDNSIIVIDNISQRMDRGDSLFHACTKGASEVFRPLLSSVLTTCAVFVPLIFLSGIAGSLFYDQAIAVTIGLAASLGVSVTLIPVYFHLIYQNKAFEKLNEKFWPGRVIRLEGIYRRGHHWSMKNQWVMLVIMIVLLGGVYPVYSLVDKQQFPDITEVSAQFSIDWNENVNVEENQRRVREMEQMVMGKAEQANALVGEQQFILSSGANANGGNEVLFYVKCSGTEELALVKKELMQLLDERYPTAVYQVSGSENAFTSLFQSAEAPLVARVYIRERESSVDELDILLPVQNQLSATFKEVQELPTDEVIDVYLNYEMIQLYEVPAQRVVQFIQTILNENTLGELRSFERLTPIKASSFGNQFMDQIEKGKVYNNDGSLIPVKYLITTTPTKGLKTIYAGKDGRFFPFDFDIAASQLGQYQQQITGIVEGFPGLDVNFTGSLIRNKALVRELVIVLLVALTLLYFILAAQFESIWQPFIIIMEVPMNFIACFAGLYLTGTSLNIMSLIGIVVMSGIVVNDSILKVDTINQLRKEGLSVDEAVAEGGERRLKPILMTSITTILALTPFLISGDLGSELQRPLAITVISGMVLGTVVSLFYVPLFYRWLVRD